MALMLKSPPEGRYVHNHRRFVRGKRAGKAPIELLTGKELEQTWLELL
jgi:hypothetical protein